MCLVKSEGGRERHEQRTHWSGVCSLSPLFLQGSQPVKGRLDTDDQTRQTTPSVADKEPTFWMFAGNTAQSTWLSRPCDAMGCNAGLNINVYLWVAPSVGVANCEAPRQLNDARARARSKARLLPTSLTRCPMALVSSPAPRRSDCGAREGHALRSCYNSTLSLTAFSLRSSLSPFTSLFS